MWNVPVCGLVRRESLEDELDRSERRCNAAS
jgi:hypothetical protein